MRNSSLHSTSAAWGTADAKVQTSRGRPHQLSPTAFSSQGQGSLPDPVRVSFALPYRCEFGQNLSIIGSTSPLGSWDVGHCVDMQWTDGDVWRVELEIPASSSFRTEMEYKYVVKNHDGGILTWKPGENFSLRLPLEDEPATLPDKVRICDAWDSSCRKIEVELRSTPSSPGASSETLQLAEVLTQEAEEALAELKAVVEQSTALLEDVSPVSPEALAADQAVAQAALKASNLTRALNELKSKREITDSSTGA